MKASSPFWPLWGWPLFFAVLSGAGLVGGLVGDGAWDWMTWVGLGLPCAAGVWFGLRGRAPARGPARDARDAR